MPRPPVRRGHGERVGLAFSFAATAIAVVALVAEPLTRPRLADDDGSPDERSFPPPRQVRSSDLWIGDKDDVDDDNEDPVDETRLALEAERESEILGTSARTARLVAARRAVDDAVSNATLPGKIRLVHEHGARFMSER